MKRNDQEWINIQHPMLNVVVSIGYKGNMRRKRPTEIGGILHVYNRGIDKRKIYSDTRGYQRFIDSLGYCLQYNYPYSRHQEQLKQAVTEESRNELRLIHEHFHKYKSPLCKIIAYTLMPNHFHLLLEETCAGGIVLFIQKILNSFTKYFNKRNERNGSLFQGPYKSTLVESNEQLLHLSRYIHINPVAAKIIFVNQVVEYVWSSLPEFIDLKQVEFIDPSIILSQFKSPQEYLEFVIAEYRVDEEAYILEEKTIDDDFGWY